MAVVCNDFTGGCFVFEVRLTFVMVGHGNTRPAVWNPTFLRVREWKNSITVVSASGMLQYFGLFDASERDFRELQIVWYHYILTSESVLVVCLVLETSFEYLKNLWKVGTALDISGCDSLIECLDNYWASLPSCYFQHRNLWKIGLFQLSIQSPSCSS